MTAAANRQPQVFVSSPTTLKDVHASAQRRVLDELAKRKMRAVRLERSQYAPTPWDQLRTIVARSDGAVVFGFPQLHVEDGEWRPDTAETQSAAGRYATPWNQIEAGLAIMAGVPVLVSADARVSEGVFSPDVWGEGVFGLRQGEDGDWDGSSAEALEAWSAAVAERALRRG